MSQIEIYAIFQNLLHAWRFAPSSDKFTSAMKNDPNSHLTNFLAGI
jgi:hypothetical protein